LSAVASGLQDGSNLRLPQFVVGILVLTAVVLLFSGGRTTDAVLNRE